MVNYLIMHGHFYQPPRENPWTGLVNAQSSAAPFHDWNHRITRECYAANAASRFLRYDGRIEDIINNYRILSFNFGPTLLRWLRQYAPYVYEAIIEADQLSIKDNNGHGNAIAQAYNHTILPLDNPRDAQIQIKWGLADFEYHFGRKSEGMWLPEAAVNENIIDILIEEGIRFIILSPWQAEAIREDGMLEWKKLKKEPAPFWHPFILKRPHGSLNIFFYSNELAQGISFEHYLTSADTLYSRLLPFHSNADPGHLINIATDGEIYGHHEPFGDMCLAALQKKISEKDDFIFTNYGAYLEQYPGNYEVSLRKGEKDLGSSWSCHHGVSRWYKDCGCVTGGEKGWNQKWRTPLRQGFDALSDTLWEIYSTEITKLSDTAPLFLLEEYIHVLTGEKDPAEFARLHLRETKRSGQNIETLLTLLEGQKYRLFTFTSCAWFFADIDGIEAVQNIRYALKAIQLYEEFTEADLFNLTAGLLEHASSNKTRFADGRKIMESQESFKPDEGIEAASFFLIRFLIFQQEKTDEAYGYYSPVRIKTLSRSDSSLTADIEIIDNTRQKNFRFRFKTLLKEDEGFSINIMDLSNGEQREYIEDLSKLPLELRSTLMKYIMKKTEDTIAEQMVHTFEQIRLAITQSRYLKIEAPRLFEKSAELAVTTMLQRELSKNGSHLTEEQTSRLEEILQFTSQYSIHIDSTQIADNLSHFIRNLFDHPSLTQCENYCTYIARFIIALRTTGIEPDLTIPQKKVFAQLNKWRERLRGQTHAAGLVIITKKQIEVLSSDERKSLSRLLILCDVMGIFADDIKLAFGPELS